MDEQKPIILFDGVCNLCNASVAWIVERDHDEVFRFASLQSDAAARALEAVEASDGGLPDSIVLIDEEGVHTESDAAIRIARRLGFPWSLAGLARILPRPLRDALYRLIARNRYRWFGRRDTCRIPTESEKARFLDADEPVRVMEASSGHPEGERRSIVGGLALRFLVVYFLLFIFPFPLDYIPGVNVVTGLYETGKQQAVVWVADQVFGVDGTAQRTGSGDTTHNYVLAFVRAMLALVGAVIWLAVTRARPVPRRFLHGWLVYIRLFLAVVMLIYGWHKVLPVQFPVPGPDRLLNNFGQTSPMGLVWVFMGTSAAYQIFAGLGELVGGLLLFWRRTRLLGALLSAAVLANIVALNLCFDVPVKLHSIHYLVLAVILILRDGSRLANLLLINLPAQPAELEPFPVRNRWVRRGYLVVKLVLFGYFAVYSGIQNYELMEQYGYLKETGPFHGFYVVESVERDGLTGREIEDEHRWVRAGINGRYNTLGVIRANGFWRRYFFELDEEGPGMKIHWGGESHPFEHRWVEDDVLELAGELEGVSLTVRMKRVPEEESSLLTTRGFNWINEYPLNR